MNENKEKSIEYSLYIRQFWVGLMDGDGSLQVNHWRKKSLQYRLVIKLKNDKEKYNVFLLQRIQKSIGGSVRVVDSKRFVIWVENHKSKISQIVEIFDKYPPYTKRLYSQYRFYLESEKRNSVDWYLENRDKKYTLYQNVIDENLSKERNSYLSIPNLTKHTELQFFKGWLSGFIEAEGCFTLRSCSSKCISFSISQKNEKPLLERINTFFGGQTKVRKVIQKKNRYIDSHISNSCMELHIICKKNDFYVLEIYRKTVIDRVLSHCTAYPLYGEKQKSINLLKKHLYKCRVVLPLWK